MGISSYVEELRASVGSRLLLLPGVAAVVRNPDGHVLMIRRSDDGRWGLPAGAVDPGESPADAVVREVREETGLEVRPERLLGVFGGADFRHTYPNGDKAEYTVLVFECDVIGGRLRSADGEAEGFKYFAPDTMPQLPPPYPPELFQVNGPPGTLFQRPLADEAS